MSDHRDAAYWAAVRAEVDQAPPLSPEIHDRLHALTTPMRDALTETRKRAA